MIAGLLVVLGGLVAAAGVAVASGMAAANRIELYRWIGEQRDGAGAARTLLFAPGRITRGVAGITAVGVLLAALGVWAVAAQLPPLLFVTAVALIAVPVFLGGVYAVGRMIGRYWAEQLVRAAVPLVDRLGAVLAPVRAQPASPSELESLAELSKGDLLERLGSEEMSSVSGVFAFAERPVREVMKPRTEVVAVREGASLNEVAAAFTDSGHSRIPVYRDSLDHITAMVYAFDLFKVPPGGELPLRPVATAPGSKSCGDLLFQMQRDRQQLAVVLDEYGGTAGIVAFDDLVQGLVDGIFASSDGFRAVEPSPVEVVEVTGTTPLAEIAARFDAELTGDAETVSGVLARAAGRIPATGERLELGGLEFDILEASATRVLRVTVRRGPSTVIRLERRRAP